MVVVVAVEAWVAWELAPSLTWALLKSSTALSHSTHVCPAAAERLEMEAAATSAVRVDRAEAVDQESADFVACPPLAG